MAAAEVTTMILRFRDLVTPPGGTIELHREFIRTGGYVWWGWWSKAGERIPVDVFITLQKIAIAGALEALLFDSGHNQIHRVVCTDIHWRAKQDRGISPEPNMTPPYYRDREYLAWFKFREINPDPHDAAALHELSYVRVDEFFEDKPSRYTPFYGKQIYSVDELRQQDRTIWFTRPVKPLDPTHFVSLLDPDRITPAHFPRHVIESKSHYIALTSDVHFSADGHHGFPTVSTHDKFDLGQRIEMCLTDNGIKDLAALIVAGDLTWKAVKEEYDLANAFMQRVGSWAKLRNYQYMTCPGNHDLAFSVDPAKKALPITVAPDVARHAYESFYEELFYLKPNEFLCSGRRLLLAGCVPVEIVALNSSLLEQHKKAFQGHGFIGEAQLRHAAEAMEWKSDQSPDSVRAYRIVVVHHHLLPVTYREAAQYGGVYSVALDAEALTRWVVEHRVKLVIHGHMHQPFMAKVSRPRDTTKPGDEWHSFTILGLGSAGVEAQHLGEVMQNTFAVLDLSQERKMIVKVFTLHPTLPSKLLWELPLETNGGE